MSTKSENPTRLRFKGLAGGVTLSESSCPLLAFWIAESRESANGEGVCSSVEGDVGAETPPLESEGSGFNIMLKSWQDIAADLRWAWPLLPAGGPNDAPVGGGSTLSPFVGDVDNNPAAVPIFPSPPMNSLVPLLWNPDREGMSRGERGGLCN